MMNSKFKKSQILLLLLLAALLIITPLLSSSSRPTYLYFIANLLIISLGAEAGLLSVFFSKPPSTELDHTAKKHAKKTEGSDPNDENLVGKREIKKKVERPAPESDRVKKCPSTPSLFFIGGGGENDSNQSEEWVNERVFHEEEAEELEEALWKEELFTKAETFIGNFYKQLKMQREDSWKKIHGLYQKAF